MAIAFARNYNLVPRGAAGLAFDEDGVALGPVALVEAVTEPSGRRSYRMRPEREVAQALRPPTGPHPTRSSAALPRSRGC